MPLICLNQPYKASAPVDPYEQYVTYYRRLDSAYPGDSVSSGVTFPNDGPAPIPRSVLFSANTQQIQTPQGSGFDLAGNQVFTLDFWHCKGALGAFGRIVRSGHIAQANTFQWQVYGANSNLFFGVNNVSNNILSISYDQTTDIPPGVWMHYEISCDASGFWRLYIGGNLWATKTFTTAITATTYPLQIGAIAPGNTTGTSAGGRTAAIRLTKGVVRHTSNFIPVVPA